MDLFADNQLFHPDQDQPFSGQSSESNDIPEVTPDWLRGLLNKHGEKEGPLAGVSDIYPSSIPPPLDDESDDDITETLNEFATDPIKPQTGKLASSVDWGIPAEPEAPDAMDEFLANFEAPTLDKETPETASRPEREDWLSGIPPSPDQSVTTDTPEESLDEPDWLSELATSAPYDNAADTTAQISTEESDDTIEWDSQEIPDWLMNSEVFGAEGTDEKASDDEVLPPELDWVALTTDLEANDQPMASDAGVSDTTEDVPDWLATFANTEVENETSENSLPEKTDEELDWLSEFAAAQNDTTPPSTLEDSEDINEGTASTSLDWMDGLETSQADVTTNEPPAIGSSASSSLEDNIEVSETLSSTDDADIPDWMAELEAAANSKEPSETTSAEEIDLPEISEETEADHEIPDWMAELEVAADQDGLTEPSINEAALGDEITSSDDWLAQLGATTDVENMSEITDTDEVSSPILGEAEAQLTEISGLIDVEDEDWLQLVAARYPVDPALAGIEDGDIDSVASESDIPLSVNQILAETDTPDWLAEADNDVSDSPEVRKEATGITDWLTQLQPPTDFEDGEDKLSLEQTSNTEAEVSASSDFVSEWLATTEEATSASGIVSSGEDEDEEDTSVWLAGLRAETQVELETTDIASESSLSVEAEQMIGDDVPAEETQLGEDSKDTPDWYKELAAEAETEQTIGLPDWLNQLASQIMESSEAEITESTEATNQEIEAQNLALDAPVEAIAEAGSSDTLDNSSVEEALFTDEASSIETDGSPDDEMSPPVVGPETTLGIETGQAVDEPATELDETSLGWLSELSAETPEVASSPTITQDVDTQDTAEALDLPDWMVGLEEEMPEDEAAVAPPPETLPTIEDTLDQKIDLDAANLVDDEAVAPLDEGPAWLSQLQVDDQSDTEPQETETEMSDWLTNLDSDETIDKDETAWLSTLHSEAADDAEVKATPVDAEDALPAWMTDLTDDALGEDVENGPSTSAPPPEIAETDDAADDTTAWLRGLGISTTDEVEEAEAGDSQSNWMSNFEQEVPQAPDKTEEADVGDATMAWLTNLGATSGEDSGSGAEIEIDDDDALDWLTSLGSDDVETQDDIASSDASSDDDEPPTGAGGSPASGADSSAQRNGDSAPPVDSITILASADDTVMTTIMPAMATAGATIVSDAARRFSQITTMPIAKPIAMPDLALAKQSWSRRLWQAAFYLGLILVLAYPLFNHFDRGGFPFPWLEPLPIEQQIVRDQLQGILADKLPGSVALVSFDYTPAHAGEMDPLALAVIRKMLGQGLRVVAVSLEPTGAGVAQNILERIDAERYGVDMVNLGYLPGGLIAIRQLSTDGALKNLVDFKMGQPYQALSNWPALNELDEIALIVEISASPDSARWWVEQLETLKHPPLLAVVSSAVQPFVLPYQDTGQYQAVIAGINGAAALEAARAQRVLGPASSMLDSQSLAHVLIMMLMFLGTIAGWFTKYGQEAT